MLDCGNLPFYVCVYQRGYCRYWWVLKLLAIGQAKSDDTNSIGIRNVCVLFSEALQMVHVSYMLTVSVSKIPHKHDDRDIQLFRGMVTSLVSLFSSVYSCWWVCSAVFPATRSVFVRVFSLAQRVWRTAVFVHVQCRKLDKRLLKHCPGMFSHVLLL